MKGFCVSLLVACLAVTAAHSLVSAQARVSNLRISADEAGTALPLAEAPPGEKRYHLESGTNQLHVAFDCATAAEGTAQVRVMQPPGSILFQQDTSCAAGGTQVVLYDREGEPFPDNEYVVNLYVGDKEMYLADSVQFAVGSATIPESEGDATPTVQLDNGAASTALPGGVLIAQAEPVPPPGGPSSWLLAVAGVGILGLVGVIAWAGWSAVRK
jgi:hypothetical protein